MPKFLLLFLCTIQCCFSQTDKKISGVILSGDIYLEGVDIINDRSRISETSNSSGQFSIMAQVGDTLIFHAANFTAKKIRIKEADFSNPNFKVFLYKQIEELEEVVITNDVQPILIAKHIVDNRYFGDSQSALKNPHIYTAEIAEAPDLVKIVGVVSRMLKKPTEASGPGKPTLSFKQFVSSSYDRAYLKQALNLKQDEVELFMEFCEADSNAYSVKDSEDKLELLEFLIRKNEEFKKLKRD